METAIVRTYVEILIYLYAIRAFLSFLSLFLKGFDNTKAAQASVQSPCSAVPELLEALSSF